MITLGMVDVALIVVFVLMILSSFRRRGRALTVLIALLLLVVLVERVAPGALAGIGTAIGGIDTVNAAGPHLEIQPIVHLLK